MKLTKKRRENLSKYLFTLSEVVFGTVLIGRLITSEKISLINFIYGIILFAIFSLLGYWIDNGGEK